MNASLIRLTVAAMLVAGLLTSCDKLRKPATTNEPAAPATTVPSAVRPTDAPASAPAHHQTQASALPLPSVEQVVKSRLLGDCASGDKIMESFKKGFNNTRAHHRINAILKDSPASLKNSFAVPSLKADFKSFDDASLTQLSELVTTKLQGSLTAADRKDLACEVATFIHSYYITHLDGASATVKAYYGQYHSLVSEGATTAAAPEAPAAAEKPTASTKPATAPAAKPAAPAAAPVAAAPAADPRIAAHSRDIEQIKEEITNIYVEEDNLSKRINAIPSRGGTSNMWIWGALAGVLLLFLLYYRINRARTRQAIMALQAQIDELKHADKSNIEEMMRNLLPIYMDQLQRNEAAPFMTDDQLQTVTESLNTIPAETTPAAAPETAPVAAPVAAPVVEMGAPSPLGEAPVYVGGEVWYARAPHNGAFVAASLSADPEEEQSLFLLELNETDGTASLSNDLGSLARALANPEAALLQVFEAQGPGNIGLATSVKTETPAQLRLQHGEWQIVQKGVVVYTA